MTTKTKEKTAIQAVSELSIIYSIEELNDAFEYLNTREKLVARAAELGWDRIGVHEKLPIEFIRQFQNRLDWDAVSMYQELNEQQIEEFYDYVNWGIIFAKYDFSGAFFEKHKTYIIGAIRDMLSCKLPILKDVYISYFDKQFRLKCEEAE